MQKVARFCAYQERCKSDVRNKLKLMGVDKEKANSIINELVTENFINEERFARVFASGKFKMKGWGKYKIYHALQSKGVPENYIKTALDEINLEEYRLKLKSILKKKEKELKEEDYYKRKQKLVNFATGRGFESEIIWEVIGELRKEKE